MANNNEFSQNLFNSLYNSGLSIAGAKGTMGKGVPLSNIGGGSSPRLSLPTPTKKPQENQQQSSSSSMNPSQFMNQGSEGLLGSTGSGSLGAGNPSALVTGNLGSASYAPTGFGLQGASTGLTYGGSLGGTLGASSGLIGSAGGATSGAATGGAGYGLGGSLVGGTGTVGGSTFAASSGAGAGAAGGAGSAGAGLMATPVGWIAAILGAANVQHNKGMSSWSDTLKGRAGTENLAYFQGKKDGKQHGLISKIMDEDGAVGQTTSGVVNLAEFKPKKALKGFTGGVKSLLKGKLF